MGMMDKMMGIMIGRLSRQEKDEMMDKMLADFSNQDKQDMMASMMPKMMADVSMLEMMPKMMVEMMPKMLTELKEYNNKLKQEGHDLSEIMAALIGKMLTVMTEGIDFEKMAGRKDEMMDKMMQNDQLKHKLPIVKTHMMPGCIRGMLPELTPEQRLSFALEVNSIIKEKATLDMTEKERQAFLDKIAGSITG